MKKQLISSGSPWEPIVGYSRAVRIGNLIEVSGTTAVKEGVVQFKGNMYAQTRTCLEIIASALQQAGVSTADVVRTRIYVTDIRRWEEVAKAHAEFFRDVRPATTMVEVSKLIDADMLVEIEATAILP